jgi:hypothetical protein
MLCLSMIFSENRYPLCANAALWVRIMLPARLRRKSGLCYTAG